MISQRYLRPISLNIGRRIKLKIDKRATNYLEDARAKLLYLLKKIGNKIKNRKREKKIIQ